MRTLLATGALPRQLLAASGSGLLAIAEGERLHLCDAAAALAAAPPPPAAGAQHGQRLSRRCNAPRLKALLKSQEWTHSEPQLSTPSGITRSMTPPGIPGAGASSGASAGGAAAAAAAGDYNTTLLLYVGNHSPSPPKHALCCNPTPS